MKFGDPVKLLRTQHGFILSFRSEPFSTATLREEVRILIIADTRGVQAKKPGKNPRFYPNHPSKLTAPKQI